MALAFALRANPDTPPTLAAKVPPALRAIVEGKDKIRFDRAHLKLVDQNFLEFEVVYFVLDASYVLFMDTQQQILLEAMQMFDDLGAVDPRFIHEGERNRNVAFPLGGIASGGFAISG